jgi:hypothetical protein
MMLIRSGLCFGVLIWAAATAIFIPFGHLVFGPDNRLPVSLSAGLIIVATFFAVRWFAAGVLRRSSLTTVEQGALLGVCACLPGLVLDGALYALNSGRYPGLDESASGAMCAGLLLAYAAALLSTLDAARTAAAPLQRRLAKSS